MNLRGALPFVASHTLDLWMEQGKTIEINGGGGGAADGVSEFSSIGRRAG